MIPKRNSSWKNLIWVALVAIAMGYLESAVVIYLRKIYYPGGFAFPLAVLDKDVLITELFREVSTLVMLIGIGIIAGRSRSERFGMFIYAFGWWDLFYYVFLKLLIGWPDSLLTWDILFMLPTIWVGPVLAPCLNSLIMILLGGLISRYQGKQKKSGLKPVEWVFLVIGSLILLCTYMQDYAGYMSRHYSISEVFFTLPNKPMLEYATRYVPEHFNWFLFCIGQLIITLPVILYYLRMKKGNH